MSRAKNGSRQVPEMIVVGIMNVNRERDFTPDKIVTKRRNDMGGGDNFLAFLEQELIPKIDKEYRTMPYRILFGHSLGGLITAHAYLQAHFFLLIGLLFIVILVLLGVDKQRTSYLGIKKK